MTTSEFTTLRADILETRGDVKALVLKVHTMSESLSSCQTRCHVENELQAEQRRLERGRNAIVAPWVHAVAAWAALIVAFLTMLR